MNEQISKQTNITVMIEKKRKEYREIQQNNINKLKSKKSQEIEK